MASRVLLLVTDAYGSTGGIAAFNRDLCQSLSTNADQFETRVIPRVSSLPLTGVPENITWRSDALNSKLKFVMALVRETIQFKPNVIHCGHINLLPIAYLAAKIYKSKLILSAHGREVWDSPRRLLTRRALNGVDAITVVSQTTEERFSGWHDHPDKTVMLPPSYRPDQFRPGLKCRELEKRYGLDGSRVIMTAARLGVDLDKKGFERVMRLLPELSKRFGSVRYLIMGGGSHRLEVEAIARKLDVADKVVFTGYVDDSERAEHFRLADAFVMPSYGDGFGFVFIEAMACGIPTVASNADGGRDALMRGRFGQVVDPFNHEELLEATTRAIRTENHVPAGLDRFSYDNFRQAYVRTVNETMKKPRLVA